MVVCVFVRRYRDSGEGGSVENRSTGCTLMNLGKEPGLFWGI